MGDDRPVGPDDAARLALYRANARLLAELDRIRPVLAAEFTARVPPTEPPDAAGR